MEARKEGFPFLFQIVFTEKTQKMFPRNSNPGKSENATLFIRFGLWSPPKTELFENAFPVWWINLKTHYCGRAKTELFENSEVTTVMCACARMLNHTLKRFWVRGSVSMWAKNILSVFTKGLVCTENILCVFKIIRINADGYQPISAYVVSC